MNPQTSTIAQAPGTTSSPLLVLLDFDGTITTRDTLIEFVRFYRGNKKYWWGLLRLAPVMGLHLFRLIPNWKAKQFFLAHFFKGEDIGTFNTRCREFAATVVPSLIREGALHAIAQYRQKGATVAVVSASAENWVKPWCDDQGITCLATRLETRDGKITGLIQGRNCYGDEKVCRINEEFDIKSFPKVIAYGDSPGDKEMLSLAHDKHYKPWR